MTMAAGTRLGPYEIVSALGAGGMGEVYKARDTRLDRIVAIKILPERFASDPAARARFEREARAISQLSDPHICTLFDVGRESPSSSGGGRQAGGETGPVDFLVMEYLEGRTLAERLEKGPLPVADVLRYGRDIAHALDRAHHAGIVHRDLKPANIMLVGGGSRQALAQVKLLDFGLARSFEPGGLQGAALTEVATISRPVTAEGAIVGTLNYMAPEQLEAGEPDARTDVWALGCVLYEMATGKRPFEGASQASLVAAILEREPEPLARLQPLSPPALEHVVSRCLAKDPAERWQSARDVAHELEWLARTDTTLSPGSGKAAPARRLSWVAISLPLLFGAIAAGFFVAGRLTLPSGTPLTYTRLTVQRGRIPAARFQGPDGRTVIYAAEWEGRPPGLFQIQADGRTPPIPLKQSGVILLSVAPDGELALVEASQPGRADEAGRMLTLPAAGGAARAQYKGNIRSADWSTDKTLAIVHQDAGEDRLEMPPGTIRHRTAGRLASIRVSPDGQLVAARELPRAGDARGHVLLVELATGKVVRSKEYADTRGLAWSPDGRQLWFSASAEAVNNSLHAVVPEKLMARVSTRSVGFPSSAILQDIASDGRMLISFERTQAGVRMGSDSTEVGLDGGWFDFQLPAALSSDGRTLLLCDSGDHGGADYSILLTRGEGLSMAEPVRLGSGFAQALSDDLANAVAIRRDRLILVPTDATVTGEARELPTGNLHAYQEVRFAGSNRVVFVAARQGGRLQTWVQDLPDGEPRAVTQEGTLGTVTDPTGRLLAGRNSEGQIVIVSLAGGPSRILGELDKGETLCQWSTDGRFLYLYRDGPQGLQVIAVDARSGARRPWRTFQLPDRAGGVFFNFLLTRDARTYAYGFVRRLDELFVVQGLK